MKRPSILLVDDHRLMSEGLKSLLEHQYDVVGVVEDGRAMVEQARALRPDIIIADISMPHLNGIDAFLLIRKENKQVRVIFLTMHPEVAYARRALDAGASGYVLKHAATTELKDALRAALEGKVYVSPAIAGDILNAINRRTESPTDPASLLTLRQREILQLFAEGRSAKEIGATLNLSTRTIEFHKYQMMQKLGVKTSAELVHFALKHGITPI